MLSLRSVDPTTIASGELALQGFIPVQDIDHVCTYFYLKLSPEPVTTTIPASTAFLITALTSGWWPYTRNGSAITDRFCVNFTLLMTCSIPSITAENLFVKNLYFGTLMLHVHDNNDSLWLQLCSVPSYSIYYGNINLRKQFYRSLSCCLMPIVMIEMTWFPSL